MNRYRIIEETHPHNPTKYIVQERRFGTWGWWVNAQSYDSGRGYWVRPIFANLDDAKQYVENLMTKKRTRKVVFKIGGSGITTD